MSYGIYVCPEQRHEYYLNLPEKFHGDTMRNVMLYICISVYCVGVIAMFNLSSKILIEYNGSHFADILQTKIWWIHGFVLTLVSGSKVLK